MSDVAQILVACLRYLRTQHPEWTDSDCATALTLPNDDVFRAQFHAACPPDTDALSVARVTALHQAGVWSTTVIAEESGVPEPLVRELLAQPMGYGCLPFGVTPFGARRAQSDGTRAVPRRVTLMGQLSYRGKLYTLGQPYRGRMAWILERTESLVVTFADRPTLHLAMRRRIEPIIARSHGHIR